MKSKKDCVQVPLVAYRRKSEGGRRPEGIEVSLFTVVSWSSGFGSKAES